jgi:hypothetical protein
MTNKKIALVTAITELALNITNISDIDIFLDFASHVKYFSIKIVLNGWNHNGEYETDLYKTLYLDWDCENELQEILNYLKLIKEEL